MNKIKNELKRAGQLVKQEVVLIDEQFKNLLIEDLKNFLNDFFELSSKLSLDIKREGDKVLCCISFNASNVKMFKKLNNK
jgi:hypothetical protein